MSHPSTSASQQKKNTRQVEYVPPSVDMIEYYAREVCHRIMRNNGIKHDVEFVRDFTLLMKTIVRANAKRLNRRRRYVTEKG